MISRSSFFEPLANKISPIIYHYVANLPFVCARAARLDLFGPPAGQYIYHLKYGYGEAQFQGSLPQIYLHKQLGLDSKPY